MREIEAMLARVATSSGTVLITGESGVGKEKVARALHDMRDPLSKRPFIAVNCGALAESLLEAELFGYEKGAFTGANREKKGYFEQAQRAPCPSTKSATCRSRCRSSCTRHPGARHRKGGR